MLNYQKFLKEKGISPSIPRLKILEYLDKNRTHPTVDQIYNHLINEIPTLSKTTVYNTLNLFVEKNIATMILIDNIEAHYDINVKQHAHFKCNKCNNIYDIFLDNFIDIPSNIQEHQVNEINIIFKGICKNCLKS